MAAVKAAGVAALAASVVHDAPVAGWRREGMPWLRGAAARRSCGVHHVRSRRHAAVTGTCALELAAVCPASIAPSRGLAVQLCSCARGCGHRPPTHARHSKLCTWGRSSPAHSRAGGFFFSFKGTGMLNCNNRNMRESESATCCCRRSSGGHTSS